VFLDDALDRIVVPRSDADFIADLSIEVRGLGLWV
jgi:hypothetical protein